MKNKKGVDIKVGNVYWDDEHKGMFLVKKIDKKSKKADGLFIKARYTGM